MLTRYDYLTAYVRARFGNTERGATLMEYALLVAFIAFVCVVAVIFLGDDGSKKSGGK